MPFFDHVLTNWEAAGMLLACLGLAIFVVWLVVEYDVRRYLSRRRTRRLRQQWYEADQRRRAQRGYPADGSDLYGDKLIDSIRVRFDGLPVKGRR